MRHVTDSSTGRMFRWGPALRYERLIQRWLFSWATARTRSRSPSTLAFWTSAVLSRAVSHLEPIVKRFPDTRFVLLAAELQPALLLEAMQVGARHFMLKRAISADLSNALHRLCPSSNADHGGRVITILSAGGGCGATTVAVNLANELQLHTSESALIVDLDCAYATVPSYLGLQGKFGLMDLLGR